MFPTQCELSRQIQPILTRTRTGCHETVKLHSIVILDLPRNGQISLPLLEQKLKSLKGVAEAAVNPILEKVTVEFNPSLITVEKIRSILKNGKN